MSNNNNLYGMVLDSISNKDKFRQKLYGVLIEDNEDLAVFTALAEIYDRKWANDDDIKSSNLVVQLKLSFLIQTIGTICIFNDMTVGDMEDVKDINVPTVKTVDLIQFAAEKLAKELLSGVFDNGASVRVKGTDNIYTVISSSNTLCDFKLYTLRGVDGKEIKVLGNQLEKVGDDTNV